MTGLLAGLGFWAGTAGAEGSSADSLLRGAFWRAQALDQLMPLWFGHVQDKEYGGFYMNLSRD